MVIFYSGDMLSRGDRINITVHIWHHRAAKNLKSSQVMKSPIMTFLMFAHLQRFPGHCEATVTPRIRNMDVARLGDSSLLSFVSPSLSFYFIILNFTCYSIPSVWSISSVFSSQVLVHFKIFNCIKIIHAT